MSCKVELEIQLRSYIAHPYWPERNLVIDIDKKSGVNRQKSDEKRRAALEAECSKRSMTFDDYLAAQKRAAEPWYRDEEGLIVIPPHQLGGAFVQMIGQSPKALRGPFTKENFRAMVQVGFFATGKKESDGVFGRFVKLETSNQRSWQENDFVGEAIDFRKGAMVGSPFTASGLLAIHDAKEAKTVRAILEKALLSIGVGACRKMGFGRGTLTSWKET